MNEDNLIKYYNKFNEDKRLDTRRGTVEYKTTIKYIEEYLNSDKNKKILDIGAGTGKYSIYLADKGYDVSALELVKHNLKVIEKKSNKVKTYLGNATKLNNFKDKSFDMVLLFGPMYHLINKEDKLIALEEAKRVLKDDGIILVAYCMNDYAVIEHGFIDNKIKEELNNNKLDNNFKILSKEDDLYSYVRINDIDELNKLSNLERIKIITPDGPSSYIRKTLNKMNDDEFNLYLEYHFATCENYEMLGAAAHTLDILKKKNN